MELKEKGFKLIAALVFFLGGAVFGGEFNKASDVSAAIVSFASFLASCATVGAVIFAYLAWKSWRQQFVLQEAYRNVSELCARLPEVYLLQELLKMAASWIDRERLKGVVTEERLKEVIGAAKEKWQPAKMSYFSSFYSATALLGEDIFEGVSITPSYLDGVYDEMNDIAAAKGDIEARLAAIRNMQVTLDEKKYETYTKLQEARRKVANSIKGVKI